MLEVGDKTTCTISYTDKGLDGKYRTEKQTHPARVIFVHPRRRFFVAEVLLPNGYRFRITEFLKENDHENNLRYQPQGRGRQDHHRH